MRALAETEAWRDEEFALVRGAFGFECKANGRDQIIDAEQRALV